MRCGLTIDDLDGLLDETPDDDPDDGEREAAPEPAQAPPGRERPDRWAWLLDEPEQQRRAA